MALESPGRANQLSFEDLRRFEETLKPPFRRALNAGRVDLLPPPAPDPEGEDPLARAAGKGSAVFDERGGRLVVPLIQSGRNLGLLVIWGVESEQLHPSISAFLSALMETALEMVRLRLAVETDPVTGLCNEQALDSAVAGALSRMRPSKVGGRLALESDSGQGGLSLLALEPVGMDLLRERYGRRFGDLVLSEVARLVRDAVPESLCPARVGEAFLVLIKGGAASVREAAARLGGLAEGLELTTPDSRIWKGGLRMGAATVDAGSWRVGGKNGQSGLAAEAAAVFKARVLRALECAHRVPGGELLFYGELVERAGRLKEIMPLDRVLVDLGRVHGLTDGERFMVMGPGPKDEEQAKAEIAVVKVGEEESVAQLSALLDPTWSLRPGDRLRRLGQEGRAKPEASDELMVSLGEQKVRVILDEVTGLPSHRSFIAIFTALCTGEAPFAAGLIRVEGLEGMREVCGAVGAESLMKNLAGAAQEALPRDGHLGRFSPDTLGFLLPGMDAGQAREMAEAVINKAAPELGRPLRAGLAAHPCSGFEAQDTLDNAAKALVHAGFLDPGAVVVFDAVSLNVSGDALFAQGRIPEAVVEYERALGLDDCELNVLNSLGVCYGHLGQMDKALEFFDRAMQANQDDYMAYYNLGYALMAQGKLAEARSKLEHSLKLNPDHADTLFQLGRLAQSQGCTAEALDYFSRAAGQKHCPKAVHRLLGESLAAAGRFSEAEEAFKKAVKIKPNDDAALSSLAGLYLDRGANLEIALSLARRARELESGAARHIRVMARALMALDRLEEAAGLLKQAAQDFQADPFLAVQWAQCLAAMGREEEARDELTRALGLEPNLEAARQGLARLDQAAADAPGTGEGAS